MLKDVDAMVLLEDIPKDLKARGWRLSQAESSAQKGPTVTWYDAVYTRRFEAGIDADTLAEYPPSSFPNQSDHVVRVSTLIHAWSTHWADARSAAITLMREVDAKRKPPREE